MEKKNAPAAVASEPVASEPVASAPVAAEPVAAEPVAAEPVAAEPVAAEPVAAERVASEGGASKRGSSVNWASLSADGPLHQIGECLLANEEYADTYSAMRQVCRNWRSGLPEPDVHLDEWIMLHHALPHVAEFTFLQLGTSRYVTIDLSEVHTRYYFVGFCRGVIVLAQKNPPHKIRLLNPLTKKYTMFEAQMPSIFLKSVAVIKSPTMVFVTAHYPSEIGWVDESTPTKDIDKDWENRFSIKNHCLRCITPFNGELYALAVDNLEHGRIVCTNVQLQQRTSTVKMETLISFPELGHQKFYLVKSDGDLLLVLLVSVALAGRPLVYRVDTQSRSLHPVSNIGSNAFFVNYIRCISVDTRVYPTLRPGCIYYTDLGYIREYSHDTKAWEEWPERVDRIGNYDIDVVIRLANRETISPIGIVRDVEVLCDCKKEKIVTKFAGESYEFNFSKFAKTPYKADLPNDDFRVEQCASIALAPSNPLQQHLENSESEVFREERDDLDEIFLRQPILKHDLPVEDLGVTPPPKEDPVFDLKPLPDNLKYAYIDEKKTYHVIISAKLSDIEEERLLEILKKHRGAIGYTLDDLKGISPAICQHAINIEDGAKPVVEHQRRLIPKMKDVVRNEVLKLLEAGIIYPIADSRWVSPVHCVPKKGGITVVPNDNDELIPQRVVVGYRMCIDFRKVNKVTKKDHYPLPFIDQMLERLSKNTHFCFLDGYSGFSQIAVRAKDQEKTTFTCPYGICIVEVFMDDFSVYGNSFDNCLRNLDKVLQRCEETNLVLNWEKCHFIVNEGIVLGHKISERGIEVDRAKVEAIEKMPYPRDVKGIRSILGHAGFYRRFIKDFSKISKPLTNLLQKYVPFVFDDDCKEAFETLKKALTTAPIVEPPDWNLPFEIMCDATQQRRKFFYDLRHYFWDDPHLYKEGVDGIMRRCVPEYEQQEILSKCHGSVYGGHHAGDRTAQKVLQSEGNTHILVAVDYVTKWVEAIPTKSADGETSIKMLVDIIFPRFGVPRYIMTDGGSHFIHGGFRKTLAKYGINHRIASAYHPQTSGQVELSNREIKAILGKTVNKSRKNWARKLLSKWEGPYVIEEVYRSGAIKISSLEGNATQVVNGQRLKHYISGDSYNEDIDIIQVITPEAFIKDQIDSSAESDFE
ncbi:hypothetical protein QYE76_058251 [Lolium multiflorum]|uniref:Integrase catalytic domain-containing protein n=1 Tax=Lolium multiflorum TaxID=4521 RepID=A0AAD8T4W9_LOLMU|nr:hypothetical protein QYE76_058251 [Lolium multiflorum]